MGSGRLIGRTKRWVFDLKPAVGDTPERKEARLVAQGFSQVHGKDYFQRFAGVARYSSLRIFLAIAAIRDYEIRQIDFVTAFLNGELTEELYMKQPQGFIKFGSEVAVKPKYSS